MRTQKPIKYILFSVDDVHPESGWCDGEDNQTKIIRDLWNEFGVKFTFFVPANYHFKYPVSKFPEWFKYWDEKPYIEIAAHGYSHLIKGTTSETEFNNLHETTDVKDRFQMILDEWLKLNFRPVGFKTPGWLMSKTAEELSDHYFQYIVNHPGHGRAIIHPLSEILHMDLPNLNILHAHANSSAMAMNTNNLNNDNHAKWKEQLDFWMAKFDCRFMTFEQYHKEVYINLVS